MEACSSGHAGATIPAMNGDDLGTPLELSGSNGWYELAIAMGSCCCSLERNAR